MPESTDPTADKPTTRKTPGVIPWTTRLKRLPWWALISLLIGLLFLIATINNPSPSSNALLIASALKLVMIAVIISMGFRLPGWAFVVLLLGALLIFATTNLENYTDAFNFIGPGLKVTLIATVVAFAVALVIGLIVGLGRISSNPIAYNLATFYVEVVRGIPMIVIIIYVAFVLVPLVVNGLNGLGNLILSAPALAFMHKAAESLSAMSVQDIDSLARAIAGLAFGYGAYEAEVFRAGIQSIERGQMEAARSLGMSYMQSMRYVILPQAIRVILPPLGNDLIAMLKDSSLISVLAVRDLTQLGKLNRSRTFRTFETWNTVTYLYLSMTLLGSMGVKWIERKMRSGEQ
ncbi:MAG: amino acid ABC transporter permease [Anaerolineales bacterium]|jgi:polar amino acid transport system permease protein